MMLPTMREPTVPPAGTGAGSRPEGEGAGVRVPPAAAERAAPGDGAGDGAGVADGEAHGEAEEDGPATPPELVELPLDDVLDLHSFRPREVRGVVADWLDAVYEKGLRRVRIIHGRGIGVQRETVRALLARDPRVRGFGDAPAEAGGWGATWVELE